jgi:hypothetical protein
MAPPLDRLAAAWVRAHALARQKELEGHDEDEQLAAFAPLLTAREPHRARLLDDVRLFVQAPLPIAFGMQVRVLPSTPSAPFETWPRCLHPFVYELSGSVTMDGLERDSVRMTIERIGFEGDDWRVIEVFDAQQRARAEREARMLAEARAAHRPTGGRA